MGRDPIGVVILCDYCVIIVRYGKFKVLQEVGICLLGDTRKAEELSKWRDELETALGSRILSVNVAVAECWWRILTESARAGTPRSAGDALIAATAKVDNLILVTRNERDMCGMGVKLLNPFE